MPLDIVDTLFDTLAGRFATELFPRRPAVSHGSVSRLARLFDLSRVSASHLRSCNDGFDGTRMQVVELSRIDASSRFLTALCAELGLDPRRCSASVVYTPAGTGVRQHFDGNEVLTIQLDGVKTWRIAARSGWPMPARVGTEPSGAERGQTFRCTMRPGSVCFLPRGWWHETQASSPSLSINCELGTATWADAAGERLRARLLEHDDWRAPASGSGSTSPGLEIDRTALWTLEHRLRHLSTTPHHDDGVEARLAELTGSPLFPLVVSLAQQVNSLGSLLETLERLDNSSLERVDERTDIDSGAFEERYYRRNRPLVLRGMARDWEALQAWQPERLIERYADCDVTVMSERDADAHQADRFGAPRRVRFGGFVDRSVCVRSNDEYLVPDRAFVETPPGSELVRQIGPLPAFIDSASVPASFAFWCGPAGTVTKLHFDTRNILFVQIVGRKQFHLVSPRWSHRLYHRHAVYSDVDPDARSHARQPLAQDVPFIDVRLDPGDALFLPVGWWHQVTSESFSASVSLTNFVFPNAYSWRLPRRSEPK